MARFGQKRSFTETSPNVRLQIGKWTIKHDCCTAPVDCVGIAISKQKS